MLLKEYTYDISLPECNPSSVTLNAMVHLKDDIHGVLPYLNATIEHCQFLADNNILIFNYHGKHITLYPNEIAITKLIDEEELKEVLKELTEFINSTYENREKIKPDFSTRRPPNVLEILKLLPKENCGLCGEKTCMAFAASLSKGNRNLSDCVLLEDEKYRSNREKISGILT